MIRSARMGTNLCCRRLLRHISFCSKPTELSVVFYCKYAERVLVTVSERERIGCHDQLFDQRQVRFGWKAKHIEMVGKPNALGSIGKLNALGTVGKPRALGPVRKPNAVGSVGKLSALGSVVKPSALRWLENQAHWDHLEC